MITLFNSLVRSKLEYCCQFWNPSDINLIDSLENIQRNFTRKINNVDEYDYWTKLNSK